MGLVLVTAPTVEPVTVAEAKEHMRVSGSTEDSYISGLIKAARALVERRAKSTLINTTYRLELYGFPSCGYIKLPRSPISSVTHVKYLDTTETLATVTSTNYQVDTGAIHGYIINDQSYVWPTVFPQTYNAVQVTYVAGYGSAATAVPDAARAVIMMLVANWYENREAVSDAMLRPVPMAVDSLIATFAIPEFV